MGICIPITPVEPINTPASSIPSTSAAFPAVSWQIRPPSAPVQALAMPELTITAWDLTPLSTTALSHVTGAAFTILEVNVPAVLQGFSL
jgi:hypothetical protein